MLTSQAVLKYGSLSVPGKVRLANEDALRCAPNIGLFVVADGLGGLPAGECAAQVGVHAMARLVELGLNHPALTEDVSRGALLRDAMIVLNHHLYQHSIRIKALEGMGATMVAVLFEGRMAHVCHVGDSRAYLFRGGKCLLLTVDHHHHREKPAPPAPGSPGSPPANPGGTATAAVPAVTGSETQGLLTRYITMPGRLVPDVNTFTLEAGDRLLLCSDGLSGPVDLDTIARTLGECPEPQDACEALIKLANARGGPDNITAAVIDWRGFRRGRFVATIDGVDSGAPGFDKTELLRQALSDIHGDLNWLLDGARETSQESMLSSLAAAKRRLGAETYTNFMRLNPHENPLHAFHQISTSPDGAWRVRYQGHKQAIEPLMTTITSGQVRIGPLLTAKEVASMFKRLWQEWLRVETRYFARCQRKALHSGEKSVDLLIEQMAGSARTLEGLAELLPRLVINLAGAPADIPSDRPTTAPPPAAQAG